MKENVSQKIVNYFAGDNFYKRPIETFEYYSSRDDFKSVLIPDFINRYEKTNSDPNAWQEVEELYDVIGLYIFDWLNALLREQGDEIEKYTYLDDEEKKEVLHGACDIMLEVIKSQLIREYEVYISLQSKKQ